MLNFLCKRNITWQPVAAAIITASLLGGAARAQSAPPQVSSAVMVIEVPGVSPVELAPYQSNAPAVGGSGHPVVGLTAEKGQALIENVEAMKGVKILHLPTVASSAGQKATVSSGHTVNLSGNGAPVFAGITIDLTPQVSPKRKITLAVASHQGQVSNQGTVYSTADIAGAGAIHDGQTLVLDGQDAGYSDKHILIFITPRLVDASGKLLYPNPY